MRGLFLILVVLAGGCLWGGAPKDILMKIIGNGQPQEAQSQWQRMQATNEMDGVSQPMETCRKDVDKQPPARPVDRHLRELADQLGVSFGTDWNVEDISLAIRRHLDDYEVFQLPAPLGDEQIRRMRKVLKPSEREQLMKMVDFIRNMQNQRLYAVPKKGEVK